jgi:hypothetical protein
MLTYAMEKAVEYYESIERCFLESGVIQIAN